MNDILEQKLKALPDAPGIYRMLDRYGKIIYIGKSKCLKKRVNSYFVPSPVWDKAKQMAPLINDIDITVTDTHLEAMLLECESIKSIQPRFNSMMKNDRKYLYLTLEENFRRKPLKITYTREKDSFGPFRSQGILLETSEALRNLYPLKKSGSRYLLDYRIFPAAMDKETFGDNRKLLLKLLSGKTEMTLLLRSLKREMKQAAEQENFELATRFRDLYNNLGWLQKTLNRYKEWSKTDLVYAVPLNDCCKLFYITDGIVLTSQTVSENTADSRRDFAQKAKFPKNSKTQLHDPAEKERREKELLDYRDIVYTELSTFSENVYTIE